MEELEKRRMTKNGKIMVALSAPHIRALVDLANELKIPREDIVSLSDKGEDGVVLIYYKYAERSN